MVINQVRKPRFTAKQNLSADVEPQRGFENRREALLDAAAQLFVTKGYSATSMRDIASAVGMLPGSIYYHFKSKDELLLEVHREGVRHFHMALEQAIANVGSDPWEKLEAAVCAHANVLLDGSLYAQIVTPEFTRSVPELMRQEMIAERDRYENIFKAILDEIPFRKGINQTHLRLILFGALNWSINWFRKGKETPDAFANSLCNIIRLGSDPYIR